MAMYLQLVYNNFVSIEISRPQRNTKMNYTEIGWASFMPAYLLDTFD